MADVFISYRSDDRDVVADIVRALHEESIEVWWDQGIAPSAEWRAEIARQLKAAKAVVVVWSRNSVDLEAGKWVIQEAEEAAEAQKLVPVYIDDVLPPLGMRHVQAADLIDWRGDRQDARWIGFLETLKAKLEGRAVDVRVARASGGASVSDALRGRGLQLVLAAGLAALVAACVIAFGAQIAFAVITAFAIAYMALNLLFSRRRNDRAAATFLRRAFAVGWVTAVACVMVWSSALAVGAWPHVRPQLYPDFSISVFDELRRPIPEAQVTVFLGKESRRIALSADGVGHAAYPLRWGPVTGRVVLRHGAYEVERPLSRQAGARFDDLVLGAPSGVERFRVTHITLRELAIDAVIKNRLPSEITDLFPSVAGVIRNDVWKEADRILSAFEGDAIYVGSQVAGAKDSKTQTRQPQDGAREKYADLRWPLMEPRSLDLNASESIMGCRPHELLDENYRLWVGNADIYYEADHLVPSPEAKTFLAKRGLSDRLDSSGFAYAQLTRVVDGPWLQSAIRQSRQIHTQEDSVDPFLAALADRDIPAGVMEATVFLGAQNPELADECAGQIFASAEFALPEVTLRVSVIQNVSDAALPIDQIIQSMDLRDRIEHWKPGHSGDSTTAVPWPGGKLQPGQSIIVPRRLVLEGIFSPEELTAHRAEAQGEPVLFSTNLAGQASARPRQRDPFELENRQRSARGFAIRTGQVLAAEIEEVELSDEEPETTLRSVGDETNALYAVGPSVERLSISINDVEFLMREDTGLALAMIGSCECGSCPFVYASAPGRPAMLNYGTIITDQIGRKAEGASRLYLGRAVDRIEIRELEPEVTRLDRLRLIVESADGSTQNYAPSDARLRTRDGRRSVLKQGERLPVSFPGYTPKPGDRAVYLEAVGYYDPKAADVREVLASREVLRKMRR